MKAILQILIVLVGFAFEARSQTMLTIGQIYDYNINDEFHYHYANIPPNAVRFKVIDKHYSILNDTVFYVRHFDNYSTQVNWNPSPHLDYFFDAYYDTIYYTDLDTLINALYQNWPIGDSIGSFSDTLYYSTESCGILIYEYTGTTGYFEGHYYHGQYGQGLGMVQSIHQWAGWPQINDQYYMIYYRKDTIECGTADTTDSSVLVSIFESENYNKKISVYPNPAYSFIHIDTPLSEKYNISVFNVGGILVRKMDEIMDDQTIDISSLSKGLYLLSIEGKNDIYHTKFIKN
jgi:hypothetical protein